MRQTTGLGSGFVVFVSKSPNPLATSRILSNSYHFAGKGAADGDQNAEKLPNPTSIAPVV